MWILIVSLLIVPPFAAHAADPVPVGVEIPDWEPADGLWEAPPATAVGPLRPDMTADDAIEYAGKEPDQRMLLPAVGGAPFLAGMDDEDLLQLAWWRSSKLPNMYFAFDASDLDELVGLAIWGYVEERNRVLWLDFGTGHTFGDTESAFQATGLIRKADRTRPEGWSERWRAYSYTNYRLLFRSEHPVTGEEAVDDDFYLAGMEFRFP